jgi:hypothetical protein
MMKNRKHLQTNFFKFIIEKYNKEIQDELNGEETNISDDELINDIDNIEEPTEPKRKLKEDDDLNLVVFKIIDIPVFCLYRRECFNPFAWY